MRHAAESAVAVRRWRGDVIGIAGHAIADQFGVDLGAARLGVLELFEHQRAGALSHHEAVAVLVIRTRGARRIVVEFGRQRPQRREAGERQPVDRRLGAARDHHVGVAKRDHAAGVADRMRAGRAGGDHRMIRPLQAELDRHKAGGQIDDAAGDEERGDAARPLLVHGDGSLGNAFDATDARADQHAGRRLFILGLRDASRHRRAPAGPRTCRRR